MNWTFTDEVPETFNNTYFLSIANGIETDALNFDITLKTKDDSVPLLDITLVSMKFDRKNDYTIDFKKILNRVPDWAFAVDCIAAVTSYIYWEAGFSNSLEFTILITKIQQHWVIKLA